MGRRALEQEAMRFGIAFTAETPSSQLQASITERRESLMADQVEYASSVEECSAYGENWDYLGHPTCKKCGMHDACLERFVAGALPRVIGRVGDAVEAVARAAWISEESARAAIAKLPVIPRPTEETPPAPDIQLEADEAADEKFWADKNEQRQAAEATLKPDPHPEKEEAVPTTKKAAASNKVSKKKVTKKKAVSKKKAPTKKSAKRVSNPPSVGSAQRASGPASKTTLPAKAVTRARAQAVATRSWGDLEVRWQRERDRSPSIAAVAIGSTLTKVYREETHRVKCNRGHWRYQGQKYPTLYAVTKEITGIFERDRQRKKSGRERTRPDGKRKLSNWSATKFWKVALRDALAGQRSKPLPKVSPVKRKAPPKKKASPKKVKRKAPPKKR